MLWFTRNTTTMARKKWIFYLFSLAFIIPSLTFASGSYRPSNSVNQNNAYQLGKLLYYGKRSIGDTPACSQCHKKQYKFKRSELQAIKPQLGQYITNCNIHKQCVANVITPDELLALETYLTKYYRLN